MRRGLFLVMACSGLLWGQPVPTRFSLSKAATDTSASYMVDSTSFAGLASNSIIDIRAVGDSLLFFGTSRGLSLTPDLGTTFRSYIASQADLPEGGITALGILDSLIVVAGIKDTVVAGNSEIMGTGLAFSADSGDTWTYIPPPLDPPDSPQFIDYPWGDSTIQRLAVTTPVYNITWDVAVTEEYIWSAGWASGLQRYSFASGEWSLVPLPRDGDTTLTCDNVPGDFVWDPRDPSAQITSGNHNHKAFSVVVHDSVIWVGTAAGLNRGIIDAATGCVAWVHYKFQWDNISGNWGRALHWEATGGTERIWAGTASTGGNERQGVSYTEDGGATWHITLRGEKAHNITSSGGAIYVATDNGLFKSFGGLNWARFQAATDKITGEQVWAEETFGALFDSRDSTLWIGTPDGLAQTGDDGLSWEIERNFVSTASSGEVRFYAYPNPFYMAEDNFRDGAGHVRFQYHVTTAEIGVTAWISIYDFAMDPVVSLEDRKHTAAGDFSQVWDGRNKFGYRVANGVYYCRLTLGTAEYWTKVVVIK